MYYTINASNATALIQMFFQFSKYKLLQYNLFFDNHSKGQISITLNNKYQHCSCNIRHYYLNKKLFKEKTSLGDVSLQS
jgi:hypothetical protein